MSLVSRKQVYSRYGIFIRYLFVADIRGTLMYDVSHASSTLARRHTAVLPVKNASRATGLPDTLYVGPEQADNTLPWLRGSNRSGGRHTLTSTAFSV
jgi:hypothetical protein